MSTNFNRIIVWIFCEYLNNKYLNNMKITNKSNSEITFYQISNTSQAQEYYFYANNKTQQNQSSFCNTK